MADTPVSNNNSSPVTQTQNTAQVDTYKNALGGTEQVAQEIVDAARAAEPQAPQEVAGQGGTFHGYDILDNPADLNSVETSAGMPMRPATNAVAGALSTGNAIDPAVISHTINKPAAGQTVAVVVQPGEVLATKFDPNAADLSLQGKNLVMSFDDGGKVILEQFAADTQNLPTIALQNGSLIAGGIIVAQLQGLDNNVFALETAAGASGEGGTFIYSDDMGNVIDLLNKLPPIGFTSMVFAQPRPEVFYADEIDRTGATFVPGFQTVSALFGTVSGGFEDWKPGANTGNMTVEPMALQIAFTPDDNEVVDSITIDGIPAGAQIFYGTTGNYSPVTVVNGSVTFTGAQLASGTIFLLPPTNSDADIPLNLSLLVRDPDTNVTIILTQNVVATVDAVADMPILTSSISIDDAVSTGAISASEGSPISINVNVSFPDNDGSETHTIILSGVPALWIPAGGTLISTSGVVFTATTAADGTITYTAKVSGDVSGTIVFDANDWVSENGAAKLVFTARTEENVTDGEITLDNNIAEISTPFTVDIIEDVPQLISVTTPSKIYEHDLTVPGTDSVGGNIVVDFQSDGPGTIKLSTEGLAQLNLTSNGQPLTYALSADGKTIIATNPTGDTVFTVALGNAANDGSKQNVPYTFTLIKQIDHPTGNGNNVTDIPIKMVATDDDGDSIKGTFVVSVVDDVPTAQPAQSIHDETNAINVPLTGKVTVDFGADRPGKVEGNNSFNSSGSQTDGKLSSNGVPINVTFENGQYIGKAGGVTIFTMTINADGSYSFVQKGPLDHADGSNPNDVIDLKFGYKVTDYDGDSATNTITIKVVDDAPVAADDTAYIPDGQTVATGNVLDNDDLSNDTPNLLTNASVNGVTKYFTSPDGTDAGGKFVLLEGEYGTLKIYQDGKYTYTYDAENHGPTVDRFDLPDNAIPFPILTENSDIDDKMTPEETQIAIDTANALQIDFPTKLTVEIVKSSGFVSIYANSLGAFTLNNDGSINNVDLLFGNATGNNSNPLSGNDLKAEYNMTSSSGRVVFFMIQNGLESMKALGLADADGRATDPAGSLSMEKQADGSLKLVYTNGAGEKQYVDATIFTSEKDFNSDGLAHTIAGQAPGTTNDALFGFEDLVGTGDRDFNDIIFKVDVAERYTPGGDMKDEFSYTVVDKDGDSSSANLDINIIDNGPGIAPNIVANIDESTLNSPIGGTIVVENATNYVLVPGNTSDGSKLNGALTSGGVPVDIKLVNGQYVGTAGDKPVFTLTLEPSGKYTFVQTGVLDHADGKNPDDIIKLTFNYEARDADGDATKGTISINIADDAPVAVVDSNFIPNGSVTATGDILANDRLSNDSPTLVQSAKVNGTEKSFATPDGTDAGGKFVLLTGTYGQLKLYENGKYTYTYDTANHQGNLVEKFDYTIVDRDGDTSSTGNNSGLVITIVDNGPGTAPNIVASVDESTLNASVGGTIVAENASNYVLVAGNSSEGSKLNSALTSGGVPVTITLQNGQYVGKAGDKPVFTLTLEANGKYTFVQTAVLDHANGADPNDVIKLNFTYEARDADGDASKGTITVNVADDAPLAVVDTNFIPNGSVTATGDILANDRLSNDSPTLVQSAKVNGTTKSFGTPDGTDAGGKFVLLTGTYGQLKLYENGKYTYTYDTANHQGNLTEKFDYTIVDRDGDTSSTSNNSGLVITIVDNGPGSAPNIVASVDETTLNAAVGGTIVAEGASSYVLVAGNSSEGSKLNGALTSGGVPVTITLQNGQYVGKAGDKPVFTLTLEANGKYTFVQTAVLDHANGADPNDVIKLNFTYEARDADGDAAKGTITVNVADDAPLAVADTANIPNGSNTASGNILDNDRMSNDSPTLVQSAKINNTTKSFGTPDGTDAGGKFVLLNGTYGQLKLYENGKYTYTYDTANHTGNLTEKFDYTIVDRDGDTSSTSNNSGLVINIKDGAPVVQPSEVTIDETNQLGSYINGKITVDFGSDGAGSFVANQQSFASSGSQLNGQLTSGGVPVTVTYQFNGWGVGQFVGSIPSGKETQNVFVMTISPDGTYIFIQNKPLDHADGKNPNDVIDLKFGYTVSDADGDKATGTVTVKVLDDAPVAVNDTNFVPNGSVTATGDILANDLLSKDSPTLVQSAKVNDATKSFATPDGTDAGGKFVLLTGTYGQLKLYENGKYTYTYDTAKHQGNFVEKFDYTIVDRDGDTSSTSNNSGLVITITDNGPGTAPNVVTSVDETTLNVSAGGTIVAEGATSYVLVAGNSSEGSKLNGALTSGGVEVKIALENGQYVGKAGNTTVFTLTLEANGKYTFVQKAVLDHANGSDPNDVIKLNFTYEARDADGDASKGTITVNVADDAPLAVNDTNFIPNNSTTASGNILDNDRMSNDSPTLVQSAKVNGTTKSFGTPDGTDAGGKFVLLTGTYGQLKLYENGKYTYTYDAAKHEGTLTEKFDYTIVDRDGDTSSTGNNSGLVITIVDKGPFNTPDIIAQVDETTDMHKIMGGTIVTPNATSYALVDNTHSSGGSLMNGKLTSHGEPVYVSFVNGKYIGQVGDLTVFSLTLDANGNYKFAQDEPLDHADGSNPNDIIELKFDYIAKDADGDSAVGHITVKVLDDAPIAVNDTALIPDGQVNTSGNVLLNDDLSNDTPNLLTDVTVGGVTRSFSDASGTDAGGKFLLMDGQFGQIKIYENGNYNYTYDTANHGPDFDRFDLPDNALIFPHVTEQNPIDFNLTPEQIQVLVDTADAMEINFQTKVHIELQESVAGNKNGLGAFTLNADGSISNVDLLFGNATLNNENRLSGDDLKATYDMNTNTGKVVFFILAGGYDRLAEMGLSDAQGRATEPAGSLSMEKLGDGTLILAYTDAAGNKQYVSATVYTSEESYNGDGSAHTIAGIAPGTTNTAMFGFEDLPNGASDRDFNDVVFKVDVEDHFNPGTDMKEHIEYTVKDKDGDSSHANLDIDIIDKGVAPAPLMAQNNSAARFASTDATALSVAALTLAMVSHDDILLNSFDLNDTGSSFIKEAIVEVRDTQSGDDVFFNFENTAYSLVGNHVHKDGVDTGIDATINKTAVGNFEVHIIGEASTTEYGALLKTIHFDGSENAASDNRFVDVTITDEQSHTSSIATVHSDDAVASTETYQNIAAVDAGHEVLTGTEGADSFVLAQGGHEADTIVDYHSEQGDRLDLSDLLSGSTYTPGLSVVDDYVKIDSATGNVYVDATGHGTFDNSNHVATIDNISAVDVVNVLLNDQEGNKVIHTV